MIHTVYILCFFGPILSPILSNVLVIFFLRSLLSSPTELFELWYPNSLSPFFLFFFFLFFFCPQTSFECECFLEFVMLLPPNGGGDDATYPLSFLCPYLCAFWFEFEMRIFALSSCYMIGMDTSMIESDSIFLVLNGNRPNGKSIWNTL